jgi:hypothetical protein
MAIQLLLETASALLGIKERRGVVLWIQRAWIATLCGLAVLTLIVLIVGGFSGALQVPDHSRMIVLVAFAIAVTSTVAAGISVFLVVLTRRLGRSAGEEWEIRMSVLIDKNTTVICQGFTGKNGTSNSARASAPTEEQHHGEHHTRPR